MTKGLPTPASDQFRNGTVSIEAEPLRGLWASVLLQALDDAVRGFKVHGAKADDNAAHIERARDYFITENEDLDCICEILGLNPDVVRKQAKQQISAAPSPEELASRRGNRVARFSAEDRKYRDRKVQAAKPSSKKPRKQSGVVLDLPAFIGTGGGRSEQDSSEIKFSGKAA